MCYALREILIESYNRALILIETFIDPPTTDVIHEIAEIHNGLLNLCKLIKLMCWMRSFSHFHFHHLYSKLLPGQETGSSL